MKKCIKNMYNILHSITHYSLTDRPRVVRSGSQLGASWVQLGASWAPLGANLGALGPHLAALGRSWAQLGAFWEPQGLHLALPTGLLLYFICTAQGAAKFNSTSFVVPQGLPSATEEHCQRSSLSMESTGAD